MASRSPHSLVAPMSRLIAEERRRQTNDRDLLGAFVRGGESDAFAELLRRHGPMVLRLALHLLHHRPDAEDVFQAVFLTLARKADSLRDRASVAAWLHRVTWRLALRSRAASARRGLHLPAPPRPEQRDPSAEISLRESQALLHQELAALPERLRLPLVLCYLQERTRDEAARQLGWSLGTLKRRLERGRQLLHARLTRRGLTLSAVVSATLLASTEVPASLAENTLRLATHGSAGLPAVPPAVAVLLAEASSSAKLKALGAMVLVLATFAAGAGAWVYHGPAGESSTPAGAPSSSKPPAPKADEAPRPGRDLFGDPLPAGAVARLGTVRFRHADYLRKIDFAADGKTVMSAGRDGVRVWEAATGRPLRHIGAGVDEWSTAFSPDRRRVALCRRHASGPVEVWDVATGKRLHRLGNRYYSLVCFSPDGKRLAGLSGEHTPGSTNLAWDIDIWDPETGRDIRTLTGPKEYVSAMAFSADGKTLLLGGSGKAISIRNVTDGKEVRRLRDLPADVFSLTLSPCGDRIAFVEFCLKNHGQGSMSFGPGTRMFLVDLRTGAEVRRWETKPETEPNDVLPYGWWNGAFSPDGRKLAACQLNGPVRVWDTETGKETRLLTDGRTHCGGVVFSPDGKTLAVGDSGRVVRLIDAGSGAERVTTKGHRGVVTALAATPDGRTVFTATEEGMIHRWDARTGRELGRLPGHKEQATILALSADRRRVGLDPSLRVWDPDADRDDAGKVSGIRPTLSPDGKTLAVPVNSKELQLFNLATGERLRRLTTKTQLLTIAFAADAPIVMALTSDRTIWRWETATGRRLPNLSLPLDRDEPPIDDPDSLYDREKMVFSPDGRLVAHAKDDRFLRVLDVSTQREVHRTAHLPGKVAALAFAPDGRTLVWGEESGVVHWLELTSWSERRTQSGHAGAVTGFAFSADGRSLISGSADGTALVWDLLGHEPETRTAAKLDACWADLADKDAARAYRAMCRLIAAPADALACLHPHLKAVEAVDERRIERLIADLDAEAFTVREKAAGELRKLGELAEPACRKALASRPTLETRRRLRALLDEVSQRQWRPGPEILRQLRAVEALECISTREARALLESLSGGAAGARLTRETKAALLRLTPRSGSGGRQHRGEPG